MKYQVAITGIRGDATREAVVSQLANLFNTSEETVQKILDRPGFVIKRGLELQAAAKYESALGQSGAVCAVTPEQEPPLRTQSAVSATAERVSQNAAEPAHAHCPASGTLILGGALLPGIFAGITTATIESHLPKAHSPVFLVLPVLIGVCLAAYIYWRESRIARRGPSFQTQPMHVFGVSVGSRQTLRLTALALFGIVGNAPIQAIDHMFAANSVEMAAVPQTASPVAVASLKTAPARPSVLAPTPDDIADAGKIKRAGGTAGILGHEIGFKTKLYLLQDNFGENPTCAVHVGAYDPTGGDVNPAWDLVVQTSKADGPTVYTKNALSDTAGEVRLFVDNVQVASLNGILTDGSRGLKASDELLIRLITGHRAKAWSGVLMDKEMAYEYDLTSLGRAYRIARAACGG